MADFVCHGDILYSESIEKLKVFEDSYLVVQNGFVEGIYETLPEKFQGVEVKDYGRGLIIPAFSDLHIHASQFVQRGVGMDKLLFDWLNDYTFPQEARFASMDYAKNVYDQVVTELLRQGTFHASLFTTIHYDASDYLFRALADKGMYAYVGKVNMDMNSPEYLCETTEESLKETERFLAEHQGKGTVQPILTPRFAPTCSEPLMKGLGELAAKYHCGLQTHLVESQADLDIIRKTGSVTVHCPDATTNIIAGIMPAKALSEKGVPIAMGCDIGGGQHAAVYRQIARAVQLSKLKEFYEPEGNGSITFAQAFHMATKAGGSIFDRVGSLEKGYRFNALVLDGLEDEGFTLSPEERAERFCYAGDDRNIIGRFIDGKEIILP